jgi:hypothetical protein
VKQQWNYKSQEQRDQGQENQGAAGNSALFHAPILSHQYDV